MPWGGRQSLLRPVWSVSVSDVCTAHFSVWGIYFCFSLETTVLTLMSNLRFVCLFFFMKCIFFGDHKVHFFKDEKPYLDFVGCIHNCFMYHYVTFSSSWTLKLISCIWGASYADESGEKQVCKIRVN